MKQARFLSERELRSIIAAEVPPQYRSMVAAYYGTVVDLLRRKRLVVVEVDQATYEQTNAA